MTNNKPQKQNPKEKAVDNIIAQLEKDPGIWHKTWQNLANERPHNPLSGTVYRGVNMINLALTAEDPRWATYNQAKEAGIPVKPGSKSLASAVFHKITTELTTPDGEIHKINAPTNEEKLQAIKNIIKDVNPAYHEKIKDVKYLSAMVKVMNNVKGFNIDNRVLVTSTPLFNYSQLENAPALERKNMPQQSWDDLSRAENLLQATNYTIIHDRLNQNFYSPATKEIHLIPKAAFDSPEAYYSTAFHEVAHAKMDDRTIPLNFNLDDYAIDINAQAKEELRAELSAVFISAELGMNYDVQNHASYVNSWLTVLKDDKNELWNAVSDSNKISDSIISFEKVMEVENKAFEQDKLNNIIQDYKELSQSIDVSNLLPEQKPNCIYTSNGREIQYREDSTDLHGSLTHDSQKLTIDGQVAYQYEKSESSPAREIVNQDLLNEIQAELRGVKESQLNNSEVIEVKQKYTLEDFSRPQQAAIDNCQRAQCDPIPYINPTYSLAEIGAVSCIMFVGRNPDDFSKEQISVLSNSFKSVSNLTDGWLPADEFELPQRIKLLDSTLTVDEIQYVQMEMRENSHYDTDKLINEYRESQSEVER